MLPHRLLLAAEMLLLTLPITLLCGLLSVGVVLANAFPWWEQMFVIHFVLLGFSLLLYGLIALGGEPPEWVVVMVAGVNTTPLLVPFLHVASD